MSKGLYAVVSFTKENGELLVIPHSWLLTDRDGKLNCCYWPPFARQESIEKAIFSLTSFSTSWTQHQIQLMAVADSYPKAVEKLKDAQYTLDQTEVDEVCQRPKRKRKARQSVDNLENDSVNETVNFDIQEVVKQSKKSKMHPQAPNVPTFPIETLISGNNNASNVILEHESFLVDKNLGEDFVLGSFLKEPK
ncbi:uncharacterized protein LOC105847191 [Hydra vulgaris]|uniref:uncharacterized protein LOC105847191 n=1 Tax=Hydra vulgaris TaxID=6087 RepID=UPI001F5FD3E9|nr:uncharacterized protein LOC105847191 [Hydra vulgaris]XP_047127381.1 uncharacterized protein LOC105847191 [Hydra vulgaris]